LYSKHFCPCSFGWQRFAAQIGSETAYISVQKNKPAVGCRFQLVKKLAYGVFFDDFAPFA
jgi:hypothetical protein